MEPLGAERVPARPCPQGPEARLTLRPQPVEGEFAWASLTPLCPGR